GQTGLSVAFDLPTQMGYDADDEQVAGEVGKVGVSISSLADLEQLFAGIPLDKVTTSMTINATAAILLAMYAAVAKKQGVPLAGGLRVDAFAPQLSFFFAAHSTLLEEVAKFRAARRIWTAVMRDRFGATRADALALRFHTQTMGSTLTAQQPLNNIVRTAIEALAAVLGGTQSLHTNAYDEALALPSEDSAPLALRTQQI